MKQVTKGGFMTRPRRAVFCCVMWVAWAARASPPVLDLEISGKVVDALRQLGDIQGQFDVNRLIMPSVTQIVD